MGVKFPNSTKYYKITSSWGDFARSDQVYKDNNVINFKESSSIAKKLQIVFEKTYMNLLMSNYLLKMHVNGLFCVQAFVLERHAIWRHIFGTT